MFNSISTQLSNYRTHHPSPSSDHYFPHFSQFSPYSRHSSLPFDSDYHYYTPRSKLGKLNQWIDQEATRRERIWYYGKCNPEAGYYSDTERRGEFDVSKPVVMLDNEVRGGRGSGGRVKTSTASKTKKTRRGSMNGMDAGSIVGRQPQPQQHTMVMPRPILLHHHSQPHYRIIPTTPSIPPLIKPPSLLHRT